MTSYISKELAQAVRIQTHNSKILGSNPAALNIGFYGSYPRYIVIRKISTHTMLEFHFYFRIVHLQ